MLDEPQTENKPHPPGSEPSPIEVAREVEQGRKEYLSNETSIAQLISGAYERGFSAGFEKGVNHEKRRDSQKKGWFE